MGGIPVLENAMPAKVVGPWTVEIGPGTVQVGTRAVAVPNAVTLKIAPAEKVAVRDERHEALPLFDKTAAPWLQGAQLTKLIAEECTATGLLYPDSVRLKPAAGDAAPFKQDVDYGIDLFWAMFGRLNGGAIAADQPVFVDYDYSPNRLDSVMVTASGEVKLIAGVPHVALALPPDVAAHGGAVADAVRIVNIWAPGRGETFTEDNLFPIEFKNPPPRAVGESEAERLLPKTLVKLRAGEPVTIVAFGDSVTAGGGVWGGATEKWYQNQFAALLKQRFPKAAIKMLTAAWPGGNSQGYMDAPKGGTYDFVRDVLDPKPDLVTIEFVNDAYLDEAATQPHYAKILGHLRGIGAEVVLITPHLVRQDWLKSDTLKVDADPRPYVRGLRRFAQENHVALADASAEWCRLWRQGIPYITLLANGINHPDVRGHAIFAKTLMDLFPER